MPLLGRKLYQPKVQEKTIRKSSPSFKIPFTKEVFETETEYKEQLQLYKQPIWTCRSTGQSGFSFEEAQKSEAGCHTRLKEQFPSALEKSVLQLVHHASCSIDTLVNNIEKQITSRFEVGEIVHFAKTKGLQGRIISVDELQQNSLQSGSPSSDKENQSSDHESLLSSGKSKLPYQYSVRLAIEDKVIRAVPASELIRVNPISRDLLKIFIRTHSLQAGTKLNSPWVVSGEQVRKHGLQGTLVESMLSPTKITVRGLKVEVKRKKINTNQSPKRLKLEGDVDHIVSPNGILNGDGPVSPLKDNEDAIIIVDTESEEYRDCAMAPSPEKVFLDHSYSSPHSKTKKKNSSLSPKPKSPESKKRTGSPHKFPLVTKKAKLDLIDHEDERQQLKHKTKDKSLKKLQKKYRKERERRKLIKKEEKEKAKMKSEEGTSDDQKDTSVSDSDDDMLLVDLSKKLSPQKDSIKRTLTDHFYKGASENASGKLGKIESKTIIKKLLQDDTTNKKAKIKVGRVKEKTLSELKKETEAKKAKIKVGGVKEKTLSELKKETEAKKALKEKMDAKSKDASKIQERTVAGEDRKKLDTNKKESPKKPITNSPPNSPKLKVNNIKTKSLLKSTTLANMKSPKKGSKSSLKLSPKKFSKSPMKATKSPLKGKKSLVKGTVKKGTPKKSPVKKTSLKKSSKKVMKQVTLFNFPSKKKEAADSSSDDEALILYKLAKPKSPIKPREPPIAAKLMRAKQGSDKALYGRLVAQAAKLLTKKQITTLKPLIQPDVMAKYEAIQAKIKWNKMTPDERKQAIERKKEERKKQRDEVRRKKMEINLKARRERAKRFEDQDLELKPLVVPKPVSMPDGLPNTLFGDIAMVVEFLNCYGGLLMPDDPYPVTADSLMKALVCGKDGFAYLARILVILLKTLLQDDIAEDYSELGMKLGDIPVNMHTVSELLHLCLRRADEDENGDEDDESDNSSVKENGEFDVPQELVELLETTEIFEMEPEQKLQLLNCVCERILSSYALVEFMEHKQKTAAKLWCEKIQTLKVKNDIKKEEKRKQKEEREAALKTKKEEEEKLKAEKEAEKSDNKAEVKKKVAEKKKKPKEEPKKEEEAPPPEPDDLASVVKRRRVLAAQARREQEECYKKDRQRRMKEQEAMKRVKEEQQFEQKFEDGIQQAKLVLRLQPIGTDRNHNRYWVFSTVTPGLFVEKGWAIKEIEYNYLKSEKEDAEVKSESDVDVDGVDNGAKGPGSEKSIPKIGQNLWFQYDSSKDLDSLLVALDNQGIRENHLHAELKKRYNDITKLIFQSRRAGPKLRDSNGHKELLDAFREDLKDIETHVRQGALGGVRNYDKWEKKLESAKKLKDLGALLIESQEGLNPRFLESIMQPPKTKLKPEGRDEEEEEEEQETVTAKVKSWIEAVKSAPTMSRLHVLLSIFEVCIKWEKSAENAKCKICRKKGDEKQILLCDECNQPFHLFCLRPALQAIPTGEWKCPSCAPSIQRAVRNRNYKELEGSESESEEESTAESSLEESDDDDYEEESQECTVCELGGELVPCSKCHQGYHKDCHEPPLRNFPRGKWTCYSCVHGKKRRKKGQRTVRKRKASRRR